MNISSLLSVCTKAGVRLSVVGDELKVSGKRGAATPQIREMLRSNREALIQYLRDYSTDDQFVLPSITSRGAHNDVPLSFAQQRLWFIDQLEQNSVQYNSPGYIQLRDELDSDALASAWHQLVERHEVLRTTFHVIDDEPCQRINDLGDVDIQTVDLSSLEQKDVAVHVRKFYDEQMRTPFNLETDLMLRVRVLSLAQDRHLVLYVTHHIASDAWSKDLLKREFLALYAANCEQRSYPLPALPVQYADYAIWQRDWLTGPVLDEQLDFWKQTLSGLPALHALPLDRARAAEQDFDGREIKQILGKGLTERIVAQCKSEGVTLFMFLETAFAALLGRFSGESDIVIGTPVSGRAHRDVEGLIGFFVNSLVLRTDLHGNPVFKALLDRNKQSIVDAYAHQHIPFEMLVETLSPDRSLNHNPLFQISFSVQNEEREALDFTKAEALGARTLRGAESVSTRFDLELNAVLGAEGIKITWLYDCALFTADSVECMTSAFAMLLERVCAELADTSSTPIGINDHALLDEDAHNLALTVWNQTDVNWDQPLYVQNLFERQVKATPERLAVSDGVTNLTYEDLGVQADRLASRLQFQGIENGAIVALHVPRGADFVVAVLGVLKAGATYLALDPSQPSQRIEDILLDSGASIVVAQAPAIPSIQSMNLAIIDMTSDDDIVEQQQNTSTGQDIGHSDVACLIYTSGSTGRPKGVRSTHRGIVNRLLWMQRDYPEAENTVYCQKTSLSFVDHVAELFQPLIAGYTLQILSTDDATDPERLASCLAHHQITRITIVPSMLDALLQVLPEDGLPALTHVFSSGEVLLASTATAFREKLPSANLINVYGSSEVGADVTFHDRAHELAEIASVIGKPISNSYLYVVNETMVLQPIGAVGQLCVSGAGLAAGYHQQPKLTDECFVSCPFDGVEHAKMFLTGDRVRWLANGTLQYLGRQDQQIKIRGVRVEPGEVEFQLLALASIREAIVSAQDNARGEQVLVAYLTSHVDRTSDNNDALRIEARQHMRSCLPAHMLPQVYVVLDELPRTSTGKIDRAKLPKVNEGAFRSASYVAPRTQTEKKLVNLWEKLLRIERVGVDDNFFAIGGHSLLATRLISAIRQAFSVELLLRTIFDSPTVTELSVRIDQPETGIALPPLTHAKQGETMPVSFAQQRLWFIDQLGKGSAQFNMSGAVTFHGTYDIDALQRALNTIVDRHQVLRSGFVAEDGKARQVLIENAQVPFVHEDLSSLSQDEQGERTRHLYEAEVSKLFDLSSDVKVRVLLLTLADDRHGLIYAMHHIATDGWSKVIFERELNVLYDAFRQGQENPLPPLQFQYSDFANWQHSWLRGDLLERQLEYWAQSLAGIPVAHSIPLDHQRPVVQTFEGASVRQLLDAEFDARIRRVCSEQGVTLFMFLQTVFAVLLARYSNETDVVIGSPIAGRTHKGVEDLIGFFVNSLAVRVDLTDITSFRDLLLVNKQNILDAYAHQDVPFEILVEKLRPERNLNHNPLFQISLAVQNNEREIQDQQALDPSRVDSEREALGAIRANIRNDLELHVVERDQQIDIVWLYNRSLFEKGTIERMSRNFAVLVDSALDSLTKSAQANQNWRDLAILDIREREMLVGKWAGETRVFEDTLCVHQLFERQVDNTPDATALRYEDETLSFQELNERANRLAHCLLAKGIRPNQTVALCLERSLDLIVGILAVHKAGAGYVPIDPANPIERVKFICNDCGTKVLLTHRNVVDNIESQAIEIVALDELDDDLAFRNQPEHSLNPVVEDISPAHLAYVLYTSGTTGQPKGVMIEHRSVTNLGFSLQRSVPELASDRIRVWALNAGYYFDASVQALSQLALGVQVVILPEEVRQAPRQLVKHLQRYKVTVLDCTPAQVRLMLEVADASTLPALVIGGEPIDRALWSRLCNVTSLSGASIVNVYGLTETCVDSTLAVIHSDNPHISIGHFIDNVRGFILADDQLLPIGVVGELHISGVGLARGYLNRDELNTSKFVSNPYSTDDTSRLFRTGDSVRYLPDGQIEFVERLDQQVKVRGFRIELGEIEAQLSEHPSLDAAIVILNRRDIEEAQLVAYVAPTPDYLDDTAMAFNQDNLTRWTQVFDEQYLKPPSSDDKSKNFVGWNSSYRNEPIELAQMEEWLDGTVERIRELKPQRLLEMGCGTGLLLFRYASWCGVVHALDISREALEDVNYEVSQRKWQHVHLGLGDAQDMSVFDREHFDTVVINSVAQYFPNRLYLEEVISKLLGKLDEGGTILLGDLRNLDLASGHAAAIERSLLTQSTSVEVLCGRVQRRIQQESELLISPSYFAMLPERYPDIERVDILVKRGIGDNEMLRYRYEVVITKKSANTATSPIDPVEWQDFTTLERIKQILEEGGQESFGIAGVPNARIEKDVALADGLLNWQAARLIYPETEKGRFCTATRDHVEAVEQLLSLAEDIGYRCAATWSQDRLAELDLIFSRSSRSLVQARSAYTQRYAMNFPQLGSVAQSLSKELRSSLDAVLPEYMIPQIYVALEHFPMNASGKIDRTSLPLPLESDLQKEEHVDPTNEVQERLSQLWQQLLKIESVGIHDNFFALGGHSLLATRLISAIRSEFSVELALSSIFESPTIESLSRIMPVSAQTFTLPKVARADRKKPMPLSFAQRRLWFIDQLGEGSTQYNMCHSYPLAGTFNSAAFEAALNALITRHEVLRTVVVGEADEPRQVVMERYELPLQYIDLTGQNAHAVRQSIEDSIEEEKNTGFNLDRDLMLRVRVICVNETTSIALVTLHHIASDGWSMQIFRRELEELYAAKCTERVAELPELGVQYADYAAWQRDWLQGDVLKGHLDYWQEQLDGLPAVHSLPLQYPRPDRPVFDGGVVKAVVGISTVDQLKQVCDQQRVTPFMFLHTAFALMVGRYSDSCDVVLGSPIAGRTHSDIENLIGFFVNTLVLRTDLSGNPDFLQLLARNRRVSLGAHAHQHIPFEMLVEKICPERHLSHNPLFQLIFSLQDDEVTTVHLDGVQRDPHPDDEGQANETQTEGAPSDRTTRFDMELNIVKIDGNYVCHWIYSSALFEHNIVQRMASNFVSLVDTLVESCATQSLVPLPISQINLISDEEQEELFNFARRIPAELGDSHLELWLTQTATTSDNIALYVLDPARQLAPVGVTGQIYVEQLGADTVGELQASEYEIAPGVVRSLLPTDDQGRRSSDGTLILSSSRRSDEREAECQKQAEDLEGVLRKHDEVSEVAAVYINQNVETDSELHVWITVMDPAVDEEDVTRGLSRFLRSQDQVFIAPASYQFIDMLPRLEDGAVNKEALRELLNAQMDGVAYVAPQTEVEKTLCSIWEDVLQRERVGVTDDFFALGGHSLLATRLISAIREAFSVELPISILFEVPTVKGLAVSIEELSHSTDLVLPPIEAVSRDAALPLSYAQRRIWFIDQLGGSSVQYNVFGSTLIEGLFNQQAFVNSLRDFVDRHEVLRTYFSVDQGEPHQHVREDYALPFTRHDLSDLEREEKAVTVARLKREESTRTFDLSREIMLRVRVLTLSEERHMMLYTMHHIASDGWSVGLFKEEIALLYAMYCAKQDNPLPELAVQYADYAVWQRDWLQGSLLDSQLAYWEERLNGAPIVHKLALDHTRPAQQTFDGRRFQMTLDASLTTQIRTACEEQGVTMFVFLQSVYAVLLSRCSGEKDIVIGSPVSGRTHKDVEKLVGFFVNSLALRTQLDGNPSFASVLEANQRHVLDAYTHQHIPFEMLVEKLSPERHLAHNPIFQIIFALQNKEQGSISGSDDVEDTASGSSWSTDGSTHHTERSTRFDLELTISETDDHLRQSWVYNTALFEPKRIEFLADQFKELLRSVFLGLEDTTDSSPGVEELSIVSKSHREQLSLLGQSLSTPAGLTPGICELMDKYEGPWEPHIVIADHRKALAPLGADGQLCLIVNAEQEQSLILDGVEQECFFLLNGSSETGLRLCGTDERAQWQSDGSLQVTQSLAERRQARILQENMALLEKVLITHDSVEEVTLVANLSSTEAVAFIVAPSLTDDLIGAVIGKFIRRHEELSFLPGEIRKISSIPRQLDESIDVLALRETLRLADRVFVGPRTDDERKLSVRWQEVLGISDISVHDDFFALGGHSLLATRLISAIREDFKVEIPISALFETPTIAALAERIRSSDSGFVLPSIEAKSAKASEKEEFEL